MRKAVIVCSVWKWVEKTGLAVAGVALLAVEALGVPVMERPNILFVLVDDQRNDTLGCAGHSVIQTPHVDRLAEQGVRFEYAYVTTPICMSSRATIFTGMTEASHGYTGGGLPAIPLQTVDVDSSFPVLLRNAGYRTGFYGKQHVKFAETKKVALERMFHDYRVYGGGPHHVKLEDGSTRHTAEIIGDHSVDFIRSQPKERPFCLYMSFNIAHARDSDHRPGIGHFPWPKAVDGMYEEIEAELPKLMDPKHFDMQPKFLKESLNRVRWFWRWDTPEKYQVNMRAYYRMLTGMDGVIGRVQEELKKQGLADNTVIIYTADNGFYMGNRGFAGKWSHYEESLRVPLIIYDPRPDEKLLRGKLLKPLVTNLDLPATMLDLAGVKIPEKYQGGSLMPFARGEAPVGWREDFFNEFHSSNAQLPNWRGVHDRRYTYARYYQQEPVVEMLYDLKHDPDQLRNLADDPNQAETLTRLRARTDAYQAQYARPEIERLKKQSIQSR